jgi:2-polyprenyl-3-methyl-5-hydroxy-6-metoxy-1,4-benzoquinol methylase
MRCTGKASACLICQGPVADCMEKFGFSYSCCPGCGFIFVNPRPDSAELAAWYAGHFSFRGHDTGESLAYWEKGWKQRHERFVLSRLGSRGKLLDIGCGYGLNISLFQEYGGRFECQGIEPDSVVAAECARLTGIKPFVGTFEQFETEEKFDLIFLNQVIEHVIDPRAWMHRIEELLSPEGIVVFGTPNSRGFYSFFLGRKRDPFFHAPLHLNHFASDNISNLIRQCGMETILVHRFSDLRPIGFWRHPKQPKWSAKLFWQMHRPIAKALDLSGLGLLMYVAARKSKAPAHRS